MTRDLEILWQLRELDAELRVARDRLARLPERRSSAAAQLEAARNSLNVAEGRVKDAALAKRKAEQEAEALAEQERKFQLQLSQVKKNEEYSALLHEIEGTKSRRSALETFVLERMEDEGAVAEALLHARHEFAGAEGLVTEETRRIDAEQAALAGEEAGLEQRREALLGELPAGMRSRYQRIHAARRGEAVAELAGEGCAACGERLPPQMAIEVRRADRVIECPACGRMLLYRADEGPPAG